MGKTGTVLGELERRGFIEQVTDRDGLEEYLSHPAVCYVGFDPTADSLHVGHLLPIFALVHMQRYGHRPIAILGGGTGLIGDPSGKTEMRKLMTRDELEHNARCIKDQLAQLIDFSDGKALFLNNADWLVELKYIEFLRDIGRHFSVNRMLAAESYRQRLETGLNFIEFNYMLLQAYDFYYLAREYDCLLQMGGRDQWGNIVAGIDLIKKKLGKQAYGLTFPLVTTASGAKMGKTAQGAVWLSPERTSPFDFYQYWVNVDDRDVVRFLKMFTFLPVEEIDALSSLEGEELIPCKRILAYEVTALIHGKDKAEEVYRAACSAFGTVDIAPDILPGSSIPRRIEVDKKEMPSWNLPKDRLEEGIPVYDLFYEAGLCESKSAARRLIAQGGAYINGERIRDINTVVTGEFVKDGSIVLKAGKKKIKRVVVA
ncbi:tyrosine--tRNA ligase [Thermodesulforhabdus norvegica]|uniref:Tyrosine--tRNA ligase n=1 Tax=Thermodesulforhabdus norvegica TaxID=39841 RepID=A0A1I4VCM5_9BACT|nr:tyrosine--tRNA ligase [Thermodesulforhabdus norvegica]SFM98914.1 tyrosyl-tRNA synthetase [Thermodesulforhabdus norvegica]